MPNIFSDRKLNPQYIEDTFNFTGTTEELIPINIQKKENTEIRIKNESDKIFIKLIDSIQRDTLSLIALYKYVYKNIDYYEIKISKSYIQKKGYLKYLFLVLTVDYGYKLISDNLHSIPGSMNFWKKLKSEELLQCHVLNTLTNYKRKYTNQEDYKIWGINEDYFDETELITYIIEDLYGKKVINQSYYDYVIKYESVIKDCINIRLIAEKK